jgi:hypothetical protein
MIVAIRTYTSACRERSPVDEDTERELSGLIPNLAGIMHPATQMLCKEL